MRVWLPIVLAFGLYGCGFTVQGSDSLTEKLNQTYIIWPANTDREIKRELNQSLETLGVEVVGDPGSATAVLNIKRNDRGQRVLSVSATNVPEEFEVYHVVSFDLTAGSEVLLRDETIMLRQDYIFDETRVLAKEREQQIISQALARNMVRQIRRRLTLVN